jgi:hypothetical protein
MKPETLLLAGQLAQAARRLVGGRDEFGVGVTRAAADLLSAGPLVLALREALDAYDKAVIAEMREGKP